MPAKSSQCPSGRFDGVLRCEHTITVDSHRMVQSLDVKTSLGVIICFCDNRIVEGERYIAEGNPGGFVVI